MTGRRECRNCICGVHAIPGSLAQLVCFFIDVCAVPAAPHVRLFHGISTLVDDVIFQNIGDGDEASPVKFGFFATTALISLHCGTVLLQLKKRTTSQLKMCCRLEACECRLGTYFLLMFCSTTCIPKSFLSGGRANVILCADPALSLLQYVSLQHFAINFALAKLYPVSCAEYCVPFVRHSSMHACVFCWRLVAHNTVVSFEIIIGVFVWGAYYLQITQFKGILLAFHSRKPIFFTCRARQSIALAVDNLLPPE